MVDLHRVRGDQLVLRVSSSIDPGLFDMDLYEPFIEQLCGTREYQKTAIRCFLRYWCGGEYANLRELARENYEANSALRDWYGSWEALERRLEFPDALAASGDLATATGKSWVMYGLARIMLAAGFVDQVLVLCPSTTIERGLTDKFRSLSGNATLRELLPESAAVENPSIINGTSSITPGSICIENFHQTLEHVGSSIRDSLAGHGPRTLVLNDEAHHVYSPPGQSLGRWKEFLLDPEFGFHYIGGYSGTCFVGNEYFADVITRYSIRQAIQDGYVKSIEYVDEDTGRTRHEKFQKVHANHLDNARNYPDVKPLTILVTKSIKACKRLASELVGFLTEQEGLEAESAARRVLAVTSAAEHRDNVRRLASVDRPEDPVEWITSVSMLTEGWDVQNVFQVVPQEERAFSSKLLIAQVLGRGLRVPPEYAGERPLLTVFNHHAWASRIRHLVDEVLEIEARLHSYPVAKEQNYGFELHNVDYTRVPSTVPVQGDDGVLPEGFVSLASQVSETQQETTYVGALHSSRRRKITNIRYRMYPVEEVARDIWSRLAAIDLEEGTSYAHDCDWGSVVEFIRTSLRRIHEDRDEVSEENRQRLLRAFGRVHLNAGQAIRYHMRAQPVYEVLVSGRPSDSVAVSSLRHSDSTVFYDEESFARSDDATGRILSEIVEDETLPMSAIHRVQNKYLFKTPLNIAIADHRPERLFVRSLVAPENAAVLEGWVKSTDSGFYPIPFGFKRGGHVKRSAFNPDFFIGLAGAVLVVEIKSDDERAEPSPENVAKYRAACGHFQHINAELGYQRYFFHFLSPDDYETAFQFIRDGEYDFVSGLDAALLEQNGSDRGND